MGPSEESKAPLKGQLGVKWDFTKTYLTLDKYYTFRNSRVFEVLFSKVGEADKLEDGPVKEISIDEFDRRSEEILFNRLCYENFAPLFNYP